MFGPESFLFFSVYRLSDHISLLGGVEKVLRCSEGLWSVGWQGNCDVPLLLSNHNA